MRIVSDNFTLTGNEVKIFFDKDLYDIVDIFAKGNVNLNSSAYNIKSSGKQMYINIVTEEIKVEGKESKLYLENVEMFSDGQIIVNNLSGAFQIIGINSILNSEDIYITGENIDGIFSTNDQKEIVQLNRKGNCTMKPERQLHN